MGIYRYSQWEGSEELATPNIDEIMAEIERDLMSDIDPTKALELTQRDGLTGQQGRRLMGIEELLQRLRKLEKQLKNAQHNCSMDMVDEELVRELLGDEAADELKRLRHITQMLEKVGYVSVKGDKYELSPTLIRKIGQKALEDIFIQLRKDRPGGHNIATRGSGGERIEETKQYEFGDDFQLHLQKTIMNSLYRETGRVPVRLNTEDFEIYKTEAIARSVTVLMLDLSVSMTRRGNFEAAKQVAIALDTLIRDRYPQDSLYLVGFSSYARQIKKEDLACMNLDESEPYTNLQHGLYIARKLLARDRCSNRQIILVTDGEPTAYYEGGNIFLTPQYPPNPHTLQLTLDEVRNCTKENIIINIFMLGDSPSFDTFVTQIARINKGRVFATSADNLGQYLLVDFISNKKKRV